MKANESARKVLKLQRWAGLLAVLLLVSAELWMACRFGHSYGQVSSQPSVPVPAMGDWFAAR
jgi:hypothetical protein